MSAHVPVVLAAVLAFAGCKGPAGDAGAQGAPGASTVVATVAPGIACPYGGVSVSAGGETAFACNGAPGPRGDPGANGDPGMAGTSIAPGTCQVGQAVVAVASDGTVTCAETTPQRVIRYNVFDTYIESCCWVAGNDPSLFGSVTPSTWSDSSGVASQIVADAETLRTLFNKKLYPGKNALVSSERWSDASSTNGKITVALLRIRNSTGATINWQPSFRYTSHVNWGEQASVALNGQSVWASGANAGPNSTASPVLSIPANRTSTAIWAVGSSPNWNSSTGYFRLTMLAFYNNSLALPAGLALVDDLEWAEGDLW